MTTPTETPPTTDPIRDAFEAISALLRFLIMGRVDTAKLTVAERLGVDAGDAIGMIRHDRSELMVKMFDLCDLIKRAAEEHARRTTIEGCDVCGRTPTTAGIETTGEERHTCAEHTDEPPLTEEELRAAEARCERATPGPWLHLIRREKGQDPASDDTAHVVRTADGPITEHLTTDDAAFIAAARTDLPRALREIRRLRAHLLHAHDAANKLYQAVVEIVSLTDEAVDADDLLRAVDRLRAALDPAEIEACAKEATRRDGLEAEIRRLTGELAAIRAQPAAQARILIAAHTWHDAAALGCPRDCPVEEKERRIGRAEQELSDAVRDAHHAHRDAMFAKLTAINGRGPNVSAVEGGPILVPPPERRPDSPPSSDPLAGLPAEEQARILASAEKAQARRANPWQTTRQAHAPSCPYRRDALNVCLCADELYKGTIAREVAAYHARLPVNSIGTCSRCGYYGPGPGHDCPALTPAEQAEIIAGAPGQIGPGQTPIGHPARVRCKRCRYESTTGARHEGDVCPNEGCGGILRAARPIADVLAEIDERTAGPGPLAGDGATSKLS
jgi:hypothetical protein